MTLSRVLASLVLAAILGLAGAPADAQNRSKRPPTVATDPDEAFLQARQAAAQGDIQRFEAAAAVAAGHPLSIYLEYWRLRFKLGGLRTVRNGNAVASTNGEADPQLRAFIERQDGSLVADLMRREWMNDLARRGAWPAFDAQHARSVLRDDGQTHCWAGLSAHRRGQPLPPETRAVLRQPRELGEACTSLVETLARDGAIDRADLWRRLKLALEGNALNTVRRLATMIELSPGAVEAALQRPAKVIGSAASPEIEVIAATQLARQEPSAAGERLGELSGLPAEDRAFVAIQVASQGMRRLAPQSHEWARIASELARRTTPPVASDDSLDWLVRAALRASDWALVQAVIAQMSPEGRAEPTWTYWNARADRALGRTAEADAQLRRIAGQFHFYGQLASEDLGQPFVLPRPPAPPTAEEIAAVSRIEAFTRALKFYDLGLRADGNREWNFQLRSMNDRQLNAAAEWACRRAVLDRCVNTAERTVAEHDFALRFITPFRDQLAPFAEERGLDPAWVYGLIRQESRFLMDARSSASAQGLMQIIPPTARWIARKLGVSDFRLEHLNDTPTNLRFGTFYLKSVLDDLDGSPLLASAGYNAGPNRPRRWRSTLPAPVEGAVFAEMIPFSETRDYVKKVLSNAAIYAQMMTGEQQSLKSKLGTVAPAPSKPSELP